MNHKSTTARIRSLVVRINRRTAFLALGLGCLAVSAIGCNSESTTGPIDSSVVVAPAIPAPTNLHFDLDFFTAPREKASDGSQENYFNARVRLAVIGVVAEFILAPPVGALALALDTVPARQADGSYIWVYTYVDGQEEFQLRLRGLPIGDRVEWEMRVSASDEEPPVVNELWFEGETRRDGDTGFFRFHDFTRDGDPIVARIDWKSDAAGDELVFTDLDENPNDTLAFRARAALNSIELMDASEGVLSFIRWDETDGSGSLRAPDYNDGAEACWDDRQRDAVCPAAS